MGLVQATTETIRWRTACEQVEQHLQSARNIRVVTRPIRGSFVGDLDGAEIHISSAATDQQRLFLLAHLFGHTAQWNLDPTTWELGKLHQPPVEPKLLEAVMAYETEAAEYGLGLLHEAGVREFDRWYCDYASCDAAYLRHYYVTGERLPVESFWRDRAIDLKARHVPAFGLRSRGFRGDGLVI